MHDADPFLSAARRAAAPAAAEAAGAPAEAPSYVYPVVPPAQLPRKVPPLPQLPALRRLELPGLPAESVGEVLQMWDFVGQLSGPVGLDLPRVSLYHLGEALADPTASPRLLAQLHVALLELAAGDALVSHGVEPASAVYRLCSVPELVPYARLAWPECLRRLLENEASRFGDEAATGPTDEAEDDGDDDDEEEQAPAAAPVGAPAPEPEKQHAPRGPADPERRALVQVLASSSHYLAMTCSQRVRLLHFLVDRVVDSALLREVLDGEVERAAELRQSLRTAEAELETLSTQAAIALDGPDVAPELPSRKRARSEVVVSAQTGRQASVQAAKVQKSLQRAEVELSSCRVRNEALGQDRHCSTYWHLGAGQPGPGVLVQAPHNVLFLSSNASAHAADAVAADLPPEPAWYVVDRIDQLQQLVAYLHPQAKRECALREVLAGSMADLATAVGERPPPPGRQPNPVPAAGMGLEGELAAARDLLLKLAARALGGGRPRAPAAWTDAVSAAADCTALARCALDLDVLAAAQTASPG